MNDFKNINVIIVNKVSEDELEITIGLVDESKIFKVDKEDLESPGLHEMMLNKLASYSVEIYNNRMYAQMVEQQAITIDKVIKEAMEG